MPQVWTSDQIKQFQDGPSLSLLRKAQSQPLRAIPGFKPRQG
jgi:hypothetical protein